MEACEPENACILDAGCGTGRMMELLGNKGIVDGFDVSPHAQQFCIKRGIQTIQLQDLNTWEPRQESYDIIICLDVLYHKTIIDERLICSQFHKALKPHGILILNLPAFEFLKRQHDIAVHTKRRFTKSPTVKFLKEADFHIDFASYRLPHIFLLMIVKKIFDRIFSNKGVHSDLLPLPEIINGFLYQLNKLDNFILRHRISWPFGGSLFIQASKR